MARAGDSAGPAMAGAAAAMEQEAEAEATCLQSFELYESESVSLPMRWFTSSSAAAAGEGGMQASGSVDSGEARVGIRLELLGILAVRVVWSCHFASIRAK